MKVMNYALVRHGNSRGIQTIFTNLMYACQSKHVVVTAGVSSTGKTNQSVCLFFVCLCSEIIIKKIKVNMNKFNGRQEKLK